MGGKNKTRQKKYIIPHSGGGNKLQLRKKGCLCLNNVK